MFKVILTSAFCCFLFSGLVYAKEFKGVTMADEIKVGETTLKLNGMGIRKAMSLFDVYVAGLYVATPSKNAEDLLKAATPKRLVMHFKRFVEKSKLKDAWQEGFEKNADKDYKFSSDINKLNSQMSHVQTNDEIIYTFYSDRAEIAVKDKPILIIEGAAFSETLLKVFIGNPPDSDLKKGLLGEI